MPVIDYSKYPFLKSLHDELKRYGSTITLKDLLTLSKDKMLEARARIENVIKERQNVPYSQLHGDTILTFYLSILLVAALGSKILTEKFVDSETNLFRQQLMSEKPEVVVEIAKQMGINVNVENLEFKIYQGKRTRLIQLQYSINFIEYLKHTSELRKKDERFSLRKHVVSNGKVYIDKEELVDLVTEKIRERISNIIKQTKLDEVPEEIKKIADEMRGRKTPPCIAELMKRRENLNDEEKKILVTYLLDIGSDIKGFDVKLDKRRYIVYSCKRLKEMGLCVSDCGVKNPLQLYYGKLL